MKHILFSTLFLCLTLVVAAQDLKTLVNANFSIEYPADWELNESGFMGTTFGLFSPLAADADMFRENVNLIVQDFNGVTVTLEEFAALLASQIKSFITNANIKSNERIGDHQRVIYEGDQGQFNLTFEQYYWVTEDQAYILTLTCE